MGHLGLSLLTILATANVQAAAPLSADDVLFLVETRGSHGAVSEIWSSRENTQQFLAGVSSADARWRKAAQAVAPAADAGAAEELDDAIAVAFLKKPYDLLPWLQQHWWGGSRSVCVFSYDDELPGGVKKYISELRTALSKQPPHGSSALRNQCLKGLQQTRRALPAAPNNSFKPKPLRSSA
jgi:hypothetical protein